MGAHDAHPKYIDVATVGNRPFSNTDECQFRPETRRRPVRDCHDMESKKAGRLLSRPPVAFAFFYYERLICLLEHAHDLVDDSEENRVVIVICFERTEGVGMSVE